MPLTANSLTIPQVLEIAVANNPSLLKREASVTASEREIISEGGWDGAMFGYSAMNVLPAENNMLEHRFMLSQKIPLSGSQFRRRNIAKLGYDDISAELILQKSRIETDILILGANYYRDIKTLAELHEALALLDQFYEIALSKYVTGRAIMAEVSAIEIRIASMENRIISLSNRIINHKSRIREIANLTNSDFDLQPPNFQSANLTDNIPSAEILFTKSENAFAGWVSKHNKIERFKELSSLIRSKFIPEPAIGIALGYNPHNNASMFSIEASFMFPLFSARSVISKAKAYDALKEASLAELSEFENSVFREIDETRNNYLSAVKQTDNYSKRILPQSESSVSSFLSAYQVGNADFASVLNSVISLYEHKIGYHTLLATAYIELFKLEFITGEKYYFTEDLL
jgi:outer membrane protein TolC